MTTLYHFTCTCGRDAIGPTGVVLPIAHHTPEAVKRCPPDWRWMTEVCWFTDMARPDPVALGLTKRTIGCDRTEYRYRVTDPGGVQPWRTAARELPRNAWRLTRGDHLPGRWWVAHGPVPVVLDPLQ